jgi:hypothetical protein
VSGREEMGVQKPRVVATRKVEVAEVTFHEDSYPRGKPNTATIAAYADVLRGGGSLPPIKLEQEENRLLDGYHRWKAHVEVGSDSIEADLIDLRGYPCLLYCAECNAIHGDRLTPGEKREVAQATMLEAGEERISQEEIARALGVSRQSVASWVSDIVKSRKRARDAQVWWLSLLGWKQTEIGDRLNVSQDTASLVIREMPELAKLVKAQSSRGRTVGEIGEAEGVPDKLVEVLLLDGKDDRARLEALMKVGILPYDVWTFAGCDERFGAEYPGRIPGQLILQTLYFYSKAKDLVIDPMAGSGTTADCCAYLGRRCYAYDAHPMEGRFDIIERDLRSDGWPDRVAKADLIFWDPPYFRKKDSEYSNRSVSRLSRSDYPAFFTEAARALPKGFKGRVAFLCSDFNEEEDAGGNIFFWEYVRLFEKAGWVPERRIQVPLTTQSVHPDVVNKFKERRRLARLGRDLVVFQVGNGG